MAAITDPEPMTLTPSERARLRIAELEGALVKANRVGTDNAYMLAAVVQMLGPIGREVWAKWTECGLVRVHTSWGPEAANLDGEGIARVHLDMIDASKGSPERR